MNAGNEELGSNGSSARLAQPLPQFVQSFASSSRGNFGVDLHRDGDLAVSKDLHGHTRMHLQRRQQ